MEDRHFMQGIACTAEVYVMIYICFMICLSLSNSIRNTTLSELFRVDSFWCKQWQWQCPCRRIAGRTGRTGFNFSFCGIECITGNYN